MSDAPLHWVFDAFELDEANARLTRDGAPVALPPKAFTLLCVLARHPGKLSTKDSLLDAVWGHRHVSESVLKTTIAQVRAALGDDAGEPRFIETVARRGYRFVGKLGAPAEPGASRAAAASGAHVATATPSSEPPQRISEIETETAAIEPLPAIIGRDGALARLRAAFARARAGQRQLVWVAGDAGIGKTTLIDRFVAEVGAHQSAHGQCVEQFGAGEPYLPVLEALKVLARREPALVAVMRQVAPTWLVQMPWLVADDDRATLHAQLAGASQERMVRELWELMERVTFDQPLLLVTEDLHWSDQGTLRLMDHFARRRDPLKLMWLASFRLTQVIAEEHPLQQLRQELQLHRLCEELLLDPFSETEVAAYVERQLPGNEVPEAFVRTLHAHTEGLPLFVVSVLDSLAQDARGGAAAALAAAQSGRPLPVPDSLAGAIEKQIAKLPAPTRSLLEAASVCGMEFRAATVAELLGIAASDVIESCDDLVRRKYWLREAGIVDLPDGLVDSKYAFGHAVYKLVFYQRLAAVQRISHHRRAARSLEQARASGLSVHAAELASHQELGREYRAAIASYATAAASALAHYAPQEAIEVTTHALGLLANVPSQTDRHALELPLSATRGLAFGLVNGVASSESADAQRRVRELYDLLPPTPERALTLSGVGLWNYTRGLFDDALAVAQRMQEAASTFDDLVLSVGASNVMGMTLTTMGRFKQAVEALRGGLAKSAGFGDELLSPLFLVDPEVSTRSNMALGLVQLGLSDQALVEVGKSHARSALIRQPSARMLAAWCGCLVNARLEDVEAVERNVEVLQEIVSKGQVQQGMGPSLWFRGWLAIRRGDPAGGLALVRDGYSYYERIEMYAGCSEILGYAAEALIAAGRWADARATLDEAYSLVERFGERLYVPELLLLQARIESGNGDAAAARRSIEAALREARTSEALTAELKAAIALVELEDRTASDVETLRGCYSRLTEGLGTRTAVLARSLLAAAL